MGRGLVCVIISAIVIVIMFFTMVGLMTTINPPPLPIDEPSEPSKDQALKMGVTQKRKLTNMFFNDGILPAVYNAQYGSEKIDSDEIDFYQSSAGPHLESPVYNNIENFSDVFRFTSRNVIPPLWPRVTQTIVIEPSMHIVVPPIWPTSSLTTEPAPSSVSTAATDVLDYRYDIRKPGIKTNINKTLVKPMKRRSISNNKLDDYSGSVILKILDNDGRSRIEIKLGSDDQFQKKQLKRIGKHNIKPKSKFTLRTGCNKLPKSVELAKDTVIAVMPNDSIVIDEPASKSIAETDISDITNITDLINSIIFAAPAKQKYKELNITEFEESMLQMKRQNEINNTMGVSLYEELSHKVLYNNDSRPLSHVAGNSSYLDIVNQRKTGILNDTIAIDAAKNETTDLDTMLYTKINHTEFDKIIFDDEETNNITTDTTVNKADNSSIVANDSASNNAFNENDSDIIVY